MELLQKTHAKSIQLSEETRRLLAVLCVGVAALVMVAGLGIGISSRLPGVVENKPVADSGQETVVLPPPADLPGPIATMLASIKEAGQLVKPSSARLFGALSPIPLIGAGKQTMITTMTNIGDAIMRIPGRP